MGIEHRLDLRRPYLEAGGVNHALEAIGDEEVALVVVIAEVAGAKEALAVMLDERLARRLVLAPVAFENLRPVHDDLAHLADAELGARFQVDNPGVRIEERDAGALAFRPLRRIDMTRRHGLGEPVALDVGQAEHLFQLARERFRHRRAAAAELPQRRKIVFAELRIGDEVDQHGGNRRPVRDARPLDLHRGAVAIPARQQHDAGAAVDR